MEIFIPSDQSKPPDFQLKEQALLDAQALYQALQSLSQRGTLKTFSLNLDLESCE